MSTFLTSELADCVQGEVKADFFSKRIYSIDASIYQIEPMGVVYPKNCQDILQVITFAKKHHIPIIPRGAGTGVAGGCLGKGLIIDVSKYMNRILEVNYDKEFAICEPGVIQDQLNAELSARGYRLGPDTSTGNRATIGGMVANNAAGSHSMWYGKMVDCVLETDLILSNGKRINLSSGENQQSATKSEPGKGLSNIYRVISDIRANLREEICDRFPKIQRRVSGYNLDELVNDKPLNLAKLITGSEGTLGIITGTKLEISRKPPFTGVCIIFFDDLIRALSVVEDILEFKPFAVELIDHHILQNASSNPLLRKKNKWLTKIPAAILVVETTGESESQLVDKLNALDSKVNRYRPKPKVVRLVDTPAIQEVWKLRKAGLGLLMARRTNERAIAFLEDLAVPVPSLAKFIREFRSYIRSSGKEAGFYGHAGVGCIHVRPMLDLRKGHDIEIMVKMMEDISDMVLSYGGAISGEHGDGLVRSWLNEKMFGPKIYAAFNAIKVGFDPENLMNPGKIVNGQGPRENLRIGPEIHSRTIETAIDFENEGGFEFALSMCNGNGECRKTMNGTMCPSFHVTNDEKDTTRARAQSLLAALAKDNSISKFSSEDLYDIMELCIQCKGCKSECPSQIDMAKMKAEFLNHYYQSHRRPFRDYFFGSVDKFNRIGSMLSPFSNKLNNSSIHRRIMTIFGLDLRRELPTFAVEKFSKWFKKNQPGLRKTYRDRVLLFVDTFTEFNYPEVGIAAIEILDRLNCKIAISPYHCCGRPLISKGFLKQAKAKASTNIKRLTPYVQNGYRIIGLEPSCILTLKDEYPALINNNKAKDLARASSTIDVYLDELINKGAFDLSFRSEAGRVKLHGHCHQKAIEGVEPSLNILKAIPGLSSEAINSGCCGMAGSFGYEQEHYDFSLQIAETRLFPAIRACDDNTIIVANGISCRQQIKHGTNRDAQHLVSLLANRLA